jgi:hypothetical protein
MASIRSVLARRQYFGHSYRSRHDDKSTPGVAIINETFAHMLFGNQSAIGQRFMLWATAKYEVVGVVEDGKYGSLVEDAKPVMFLLQPCHYWKTPEKPLNHP